MSDVLIYAGCGDSAEPLAAWRTPQAEDASVTIFAHCFTDERESSDASVHESGALALSVYPFCLLGVLGMLVC